MPNTRTANAVRQEFAPDSLVRSNLSGAAFTGDWLWVAGDEACGLAAAGAQVALENVVIALLARAEEQRLEDIRAMAKYISPRQGSTPHRPTIHAAAEMISLVDRADQFRGTPAAASALSLAEVVKVQHGPAAASPSST